jgi:two-component system cell cycle response regulator CtrA
MVHQPDSTGLLHQLRAARNKTPVLVISALNDIGPKLEAFQAGADDHLTIPFDHRELVARIHAIIRRSHGYTSSVITAGQVSVNLDEKTANVEGCPLRLTRCEFDLLMLLVLKKGRIIPKRFFLDHLYGGINEPQQKIVDSFICKLRKKLKQATGGEHYIETVWGTGYRFTESEHPPPKATAAE